MGLRGQLCEVSDRQRAGETARRPSWERTDPDVGEQESRIPAHGSNSSRSCVLFVMYGVSGGFELHFSI